MRAEFRSINVATSQRTQNNIEKVDLVSTCIGRWLSMASPHLFKPSANKLGFVDVAATLQTALAKPISRAKIAVF